MYKKFVSFVVPIRASADVVNRPKKPFFFEYILILAMVITTMSSVSSAAECGVYTPSNASISCNLTTYTTGPNDDIVYLNVDGLNLSIDDAGLNITSSGNAVRITGNTSSSNDLVINANNFGSITTTGVNGYGLHAIANGSGNTHVQIGGGTINTAGDAARGLFSRILNSTSTAASTAQITGGEIITAGGFGFGVNALTSGLGEGLVQMEGGAITTSGTSGYGLYSQVSNASSNASSSSFLNDGIITTSGDGGYGVYARTNGLGRTLSEMNGGGINTAGNNAYGLFSSIANVLSTEVAAARLNNGVINTSGVNSRAIWAFNSGSGSALAEMNDGAISSLEVGAHGLYAEINNVNSLATSEVQLNGGSIDTSGFISYGMRALNFGLGQSFTEVNDGVISTAGDSAYGLFAQVNNSANVGGAFAQLNDGQITTTGSSGFGIYALNSGLGETIVKMQGGSVSTSNIIGHGLFSRNTNTSSSSVVEVQVDGGSITTLGNNSRAVWALAGSQGDALVQMDNGIIETSGSSAFGISAQIANVNSTANSTIRLNGGSIDTSGGFSYGASSHTNGLGNTLVQMSGSALNSSGQRAYGLYSQITNGASSANATARISAGSITTAGDDAAGIRALTAGVGEVLAEMDGGIVNTSGDGAAGLFSEISNATSTATSTARLTDGDIITAGSFSLGLQALASGQGNALAQANGGTVETTGNNAYGIFSRVTNTTGAGSSIAELRNGEVNTTGDQANGIWALTNGLGDATAEVDGGTINTAGANAIAVRATVRNVGNIRQGVARLNSGDVTTTGDFSFGLGAQNEGLGNVLAQMDGGTIHTSGNSAYGLYASSSNTASAAAVSVFLNDGLLTTSGVRAHALFADSSSQGSINITVMNDILTTGDIAHGVFAQQNNAAANGDVTISLAGDITAEGDGINVNSLSSGSVFVTGTGDIFGGSDVGDDGIDIMAQSAVNIDVNGAIVGDPGIIISSVNGPINIGGIGNVTGTASDGIRSEITGVTALGDISIARDGDISGAVNGILATNDGTGDIFITTENVVSGGSEYGINTETVAGASSVITLNSGADISSIAGLAIANNIGDSIVNVNAGANISGEIHLGEGSDTLVFSGNNAEDVTVFDGGDDVSSADTWVDSLVFNQSTLAVSGSNLINWEQLNINGGRLTVTGGALATGSGNGEGLIVSNRGVFDAGNGLALQGNLFTATNGVFQATGGGSGLYTIDGNVINNGRLVTRDSEVGDVLNVTGNYAGNGLLDVDVDFKSAFADRLNINGDVVSSGTTLVVNDITVAGGATKQNVLVVDVDGATSPGDFLLLQPVVSGAYAYDLALISSEWYLIPTAFNPRVAAYEAYPQALTKIATLPTLEQRVGHRVSYAGGATSLINSFRQNAHSPETRSFWARVEGLDSRTKLSSNLESDYDLRSWKLQTGLDMEVYWSQAGALIVGITGQTTRGNGRLSTSASNLALDTDSYGVGLTATWYGREGNYIDVQTEFNSLSSDIANGDVIEDNDGFKKSVGVEVGRRMEFGNGLTVVPQAQLVLSKVDFDTFDGPDRETVSIEDGRSLEGRFGMTVDYQQAQGGEGNHTRFSKIYGLVNFNYVFDNETQVNVSGVKFEAERDAWSAELGVGGSLELADGNTSIYVEASTETSLKHFRESYDYKGTLGFRMKF